MGSVASAASWAARDSFQTRTHSGNDQTVLHPCKSNPPRALKTQTHAAAITLSACATGDNNKCENVNTSGPVMFVFDWIYVLAVGRI